MNIKIRNLLIAVFIIAVIAVLFCFIKAPVMKETKTFDLPKICVHIKGAVHSPGMYELDAASRVNDAIALAGGALDSADINAVNLARFLEDGEELIIPESENTDNVTGYRKSPEININTADVNMLCEVGVGKTVAAQVVEYRNVYGKFSVKEDIMNVPGVGETLYEKIKDRICVN